MERPTVGLMKKQWREIDRQNKLIAALEADITRIEKLLDTMRVRIEQAREEALNDTP